jgi:hypothetical protein
MTAYVKVTTIDGGTASIGLQEVEGYVWCDKEGEVHSDTLNPQGYVDEPGMDFCKPENHRKLYMEPDDA